MTRRIERSLWLVAALFTALAVAGWQNDRRFGEGGSRAVRPPGGDVGITPPGVAALASLASSVVARDPFRLERRPSTIAFGATTVPAPAPADPSRRPRLLLSGVFGPPWQAVLEGVPGREGSVVARTGDVFGKLRVRSVRPDTVVVQGADTTWKLTVRHIW